MLWRRRTWDRNALPQPCFRSPCRPVTLQRPGAKCRMYTQGCTRGRMVFLDSFRFAAAVVSLVLGNTSGSLVISVAAFWLGKTDFSDEPEQRWAYGVLTFYRFLELVAGCSTSLRITNRHSIVSRTICPNFQEQSSSKIQKSKYLIMIYPQLFAKEPHHGITWGFGLTQHFSRRTRASLGAILGDSLASTRQRGARCGGKNGVRGSYFVQGLVDVRWFQGLKCSPFTLNRWVDT